MGLTKTELLAAGKAAKRQRETVPAPELGCELIVQEMSGRDRDEWEAACWKQRGNTRVMNFVNVRARLVVRSIVDEAGARIFEASDDDALGDWPASLLDRVFAAAQRVSGISEADLETVKKTSDAIPGSDGPTN